MKDFFKSTAFRLFLGIILIISGTIFYIFFNPDNNFVGNTLSSVTVPVQKAVSYVSDGVFEFFYMFEEKEALKSENEALKKSIGEMREITADYYNVKRENARFAKYYDLKKDNTSLKFVSAASIGTSAGNYSGDFIIDRGSKDGISRGDVVITENGVVGCVSRVNYNSSCVKTILSAGSNIGAVDCVTGDSGVISGGAEMSQNNLTKMKFIPAQSQMKLGDIVLTGGLSGMYPKNLKIGSVKSIEYDNYESSFYAVIEPFENIKSVKDVFVITDFKGKGEMSAEELQKDSTAEK